MAGEAEHRDPAEIAAERREAVDRHVATAQRLEEEALEFTSGSSLRAVRLTEANNHRLQALCIHAGIEKIDGKDPGP